jgi:hypothetical protein
MENCLSSDYFLTTEAQSAQSDLVFARSGDGDRANREPARRVGLQAKRGEKNSARRRLTGADALIILGHYCA